MMSQKIIEEIKKFIEQQKAEVLVIKGEWGVGKTYIWNNLINDFRQSDKKGLYKSYAYVSLFGVDSLSNLKGIIFEKNDSLEQEDTFKYEKRSEKVSRFFKRKAKKLKEDPVAFAKSGAISLGKFAKLLEASPFFARYGGNLWRLGWVTVKDSLICIDDLERASDLLNLKDVFGLISELKEQKNCKVVLILNNDQLSEKGKDAYKTYREKIVDIELNYESNINDLYKTIFYGIDANHSDFIKSCVQKLGIKNIRTLSKIRAGYDRIFIYLTNKRLEIQHDMLSALVLFTHLNFGFDSRFPLFEEIMKISSDDTFSGASLIRYAISQKKELTEEDRAKLNHAILVENLSEIYGWYAVNEIERIVGKFVKNGWFDLEAFSQAAEITGSLYADEENRRKLGEMRKSIRDRVWGSFDDDIDSLKNEMLAALKFASQFQNTLVMAVQDISLLRSRGEAVSANEVQELFFQLGSDKSSDYFDTASWFDRAIGEIPEDLRKILDETYEEKRSKEFDDALKIKTKEVIFSELLEKSKDRFFDRNDFELLRRYTSDDLGEEILKNSSDRRIRQLLKAILETNYNSGRSPRENETIEVVRTIAIAALKSLAGMSKQGKFVIEGWGMSTYLQEAQSPEMTPEADE